MSKHLASKEKAFTIHLLSFCILRKPAGGKSVQSLLRENLSKITSMVIFKSSTPEPVTYYSYTGRAVLEQGNQKTE